MNAFITGVSSGLGKAISLELLNRNYNISAIGRSPGDERIRFLSCDLENLTSLEGSVGDLLTDDPLDLVVLNAGVIGPMSDMSNCSLKDIKKIMDVNVWSNKLLLDLLLKRPVTQVIAISSGASVNGSRGWCSYSLSKATLNMLIQLYAAEYAETHFTSLAPGLVSTSMLNGILNNESPEKFPSLKRLHASEKQSAELAATRIVDHLPKLKEHPSGQFLDLRNLLGTQAF